MKLTTQAIAGYRPPVGKADHIVFDETLSGFGLRYRAGKRMWIYQYAFGSGKPLAMLLERGLPSGVKLDAIDGLGAYGAVIEAIKSLYHS